MTPEQAAKARAILSPKELEALQKSGENPANRLSPQTAAQFFSLFLQGYTVAEIHKQNSSFGELGFGLIVRARIEYNWDEEREKYTAALMERTRQSTEKTTLEAIQFAADGMAVYHKIMGDRFRRFLQTGDTAELGDFKDMTFKSYRDFVELLQALTADKTKSAKEPSVSDNPSIGQALNELTPDSPLSSDQAMEILNFLVKDNKQ